MPNGDEQSASLSSPEDLKLTFEAGHIHLFDSVLRLDLQEPVQDVFLIGLLVRRPILRGKYKRIRTSPTQLLFQKLCKMFKYCLFCQSCHSQTLPTSDYSIIIIALCMYIRSSLLRHLQRVRLRPGPLRLRRRRRRRLRPGFRVRWHRRLLGIARSARIGAKFKLEFFLLLSLSLPNVFFIVIIWAKVPPIFQQRFARDRWTGALD